MNKAFLGERGSEASFDLCGRSLFLGLNGLFISRVEELHPASNGGRR